MTPKQIAQALAGLVLLVALGFGAYAAWSYKAMAQQVTELEDKVADYDELKRGIETLNREAIRRAEFDAALRGRRATITQSIQKAADEDPEAGAYLRTRIPDGVRDAYLRGAVPPAVPH